MSQSLLGSAVLRRALLVIVTLIGAAAAVSCSDLLFGARGGGVARIVIEPRFSERDAAIYASLDRFGLAVQTLRIVLRRPNSADTLADTTVTLAEGQDSVLVQIQVTLSHTEETLTATMEMRSGTILVFSGSTTVVARVGVGALATPPPILVPVWVGPGKEATRIRISPRDPTVPASGNIAFTATAFDANDTPVVDAEYEARWQWVVLDPALASFASGTSVLTGKGTAGVARVMVFTPNLLRDTVRVTLANLLPTTIAFTNGVEILDLGGTKAAPATVKGQDGTPISGIAVTYASRSPGIATVNTAGVITGISKGQAVIVASVQGTPAITDSTLAVIADVNGPVVLSSVGFTYPTNTTFSASVFVDMRGSTKRLGSTTIDVEWNPAQLQFQSTAPGGSGVSPTVNTASASTGKLTLAMADVAGFPGRVELLRITFTTSSTQSLGELKLTAREVNASDYSDLLPLTLNVTHALSIR